MTCSELEQYAAFNCVGNDKLHILVPRDEVAKDMLIWAAVFFLFFMLVESILILNVIQDKIAWLVLLMPLPAVGICVILFGMWRKWQSTGQIVELDKQGRRLVIEERKANILPSRRTIAFEDIEGFSVTPFLVYRSGTSLTAASHTKGFCVSVKFVPKKLFWFVHKDAPRIGIGGYLKRNEAKALQRWLSACLKAG